jgi:hypothetical protein
MPLFIRPKVVDSIHLHWQTLIYGRKFRNEGTIHRQKRNRCAFSSALLFRMYINAPGEVHTFFSAGQRNAFTCWSSGHRDFTYEKYNYICLWTGKSK